MAVLSNLEPKAVFEYFEKLCAVPHGSHNTKQISDLCVSFAQALGHDVKEFARLGLFAGRPGALRRACEALGGVPQRVGDVSSLIPLFDFMPVMVQFWDADEEFDAVLKIMWDRNTLDFMHFETTFYAAGHLLRRLKEYS